MNLQLLFLLFYGFLVFTFLYKTYLKSIPKQPEFSDLNLTIASIATSTPSKTSAYQLFCAILISLFQKKLFQLDLSLNTGMSKSDKLAEKYHEDEKLLLLYLSYLDLSPASISNNKHILQEQSQNSVNSKSTINSSSEINLASIFCDINRLLTRSLRSEYLEDISMIQFFFGSIYLFLGYQLASFYFHLPIDEKNILFYLYILLSSSTYNLAFYHRMDLKSHWF